MLRMDLARPSTIRELFPIVQRAHTTISTWWVTESWVLTCIGFRFSSTMILTSMCREIRLKSWPFSRWNADLLTRATFTSLFGGFLPLVPFVIWCRFEFRSLQYHIFPILIVGIVRTKDCLWSYIFVPIPIGDFCAFESRIRISG